MPVNPTPSKYRECGTLARKCPTRRRVVVALVAVGKRFVFRGMRVPGWVLGRREREQQNGGAVSVQSVATDDGHSSVSYRPSREPACSRQQFRSAGSVADLFLPTRRP